VRRRKGEPQRRVIKWGGVARVMPSQPALLRRLMLILSAWTHCSSTSHHPSLPTAPLPRSGLVQELMSSLEIDIVAVPPTE